MKPSKKPRTKSLPQLPHAKVSYQPPPNLRELMGTRIGEIKTNYIPYPDARDNNYTFSNSADTSCDDKEGHYVVRPGELFANNRFEIKKMLGQGTFGKVVSAHDHKNNETVAIKIIRAVPKYREASKIELRVLSTIKKHDPNNENHCIHLRECFDYRKHICIVTDLLQISLFDFMENNNFIPFPGSHIQAIAKQLIRSVAFLHDLKLIHTDLKPENILLHDSSFSKKPYNNSAYSKILKDPLIQIIDFGSAIFDDEYHSQVVSTRHYRAPEIVLNIGWSFPCDMWSLGCILVELATGETLFRTHEDLEHLAMMEKFLNKPMPLHLVNECYSKNEKLAKEKTNVELCFDPKTGKLLFPNKKTPVRSLKTVNSILSLDELISSKIGMKINYELTLEENFTVNNIKRLSKDKYRFWYYFIDLIKQTLTYDPNKRLKAIDALNHHWFDLGIYDEGTI
ncbi:hypothetical protein PACTADRAFT_71070 [Pachysolen tannophilus NRRL Y-2460]|uniref:Protein kinase domain-containing protein n=1 Tax=Pachysolen tannophilus NRRL Y-2460 TaxID=669874 RepID=A0A1E4TRU3_PACTA|nr:hypothetical protein PACTADRAFT_71070 [Pachysolen tannophilus NRRL Y-2460]